MHDAQPGRLHLAIALSGLSDVVRQLSLAIRANVGHNTALFHHLAGYGLDDSSNGPLAQLRLGHSKEFVEGHCKVERAALLKEDNLRGAPANPPAKQDAGCPHSGRTKD